MNKKLLRSILAIAIIGIVYFVGFHKEDVDTSKENVVISIAGKQIKKTKKTPEERALFAQERLEHELKFQRNPLTGKIPLDEKQKELEIALEANELAKLNRVSSRTYTSRGPANLGGRTRAIHVDISDATSNTIIAGGVSSGLFRTINGGTSWTKVSPNDDIHNVTAITQDPRAGSQNIWYYATGEGRGNSASEDGAAFRGRGVWRSTDSGVTWTQIAATDSAFDSFDSRLDYISSIEVHPTTGDLMIAASNRIYRYDGTTLHTELDVASTSSLLLTDVVINGAGTVYVAFDGQTANAGVWTSPTGNGSWTNLTSGGKIPGWAPTRRIVLGHAPSNNDVIYALYVNGVSGGIEADLWHYNAGTDTWTDYSSKLPDEPGSDSSGNDPFAVQGGYDLVVEVKPNDENFVVIGGTNAYKIEDIQNDAMFSRIGGYLNNTGYSLYATFPGDTHHPDVHELHFDPNNADILYSGTDGGVHKTTDITDFTVKWTNLNNDYLTYQYYFVAIDPLSGSDIIVGGAQDNGTTVGGTDYGLANNSDMSSLFGGDGVAVGIARINGGANYSIYLGNQNGRVLRSPDGINVTADITPDGEDSQFVTYFYLDPDNNDVLYYLDRNFLYRTTSAPTVTSSTWDDIGQVSNSQLLRTLAATRGAYSASSYLLIGGERGTVYRLDDPHNAADATSAVDITPSGASTAFGTLVSGLAIHPTNPDIAMAVYSNYGSLKNIFITANATAATPTWTEVEQNLDAHSIRSAAIAEVGGQIIYFVGTARGLYSSDDPANKDWELEGGSTMGLPVVSSLVYRPSDNKMLVGTHGNGMYETTIVANVLSTKDVANNELGASIYPNPAQNELNISGSEIDFNSSVKYQISDITGKLIKRGVLSNRKVDVSEMNSGLYIINLESKGLSGSLKFLKE